MGLMELVRERLGIAAEETDTAALTRARVDLDALITACRDGIAEVRQGLPAAIFRSPDNAALERGKVVQLEGELEGYLAARDALQREIDLALARDSAAQLEAAWAAAGACGETLLARATAVDAAAEALAESIRALRLAQLAFENSLPARAADYDSGLRGNAAGLAFDAVRARLLPREGVVTITSLRAAAETEVLVALRIRPAKPPAPKRTETHARV